MFPGRAFLPAAVLFAAATTAVPAGSASASIWSQQHSAKRGYLWLSTERCCNVDPCADLFSEAVGRSAGLNGSYFQELRPWAASITGLFINCGTPSVGLVSSRQIHKPCFGRHFPG